MGTGQRVLVVDGPSETGEVLRAVLEPRGHQVNWIRTHRHDAEQPVSPSVVVLHEDDSPPDAGASPWGDVPRVIIGSAEFSDGNDDGARYLQKPYQYGELIRAIEQILERKTAALRAV